MLTHPVHLTELGFWPTLLKFKGIFRATGSLTSLVRGSVVMLDIGLSDAASLDNNRDGGSDSGLVNVTQADVGCETSGHLAVCMSATVADNAEGEFMLYGIDQVLVHKGSGNIAAGARLTLDVGTAAAIAALTDDAVAGGAGDQLTKLVYGRALAAVGTPSTAVASRVFFNGLSGHGVKSEPAAA